MGLQIGDKICFTPFNFLNAFGYETNVYGVASCKQTGEVCYINQAHGWYRVRYMIQGKPQYECFHFI